MILSNKTAIRIAFTVAMAVMASCNRKTVYSHYLSVDLQGWQKTDSLSFTVQPIPATAVYEPVLGLRVSTLYPFANLSLVANIVTPQTQRSDTLSYTLINKNGNWSGQGVIYNQYTAPLPSLYLFEGDTVRVYVKHNMRVFSLKGVSDICFTLHPYQR